MIRAILIFFIALSIDGDKDGRWGVLHESTVLWIEIYILFFRKMTKKMHLLAPSFRGSRSRALQRSTLRLNYLRLYIY